MNLFDQFLNQMPGNALEQVLSGNQSGLVGSLLGLLNNPDIGGLSGLIQQFRTQGMGDQVASWISTGENLPISAEQIQAVLGNEQLQAIATQYGIPLNQVAQSLSLILPQVVDQLTPEGNLPPNSLLEQGLSLLQSRLAGM